MKEGSYGCTLGRKVLIGFFAVGFVFSLASNRLSGQTVRDIHDFNCSTEGCGAIPAGLLAQGRDGNIYGTTQSGPGNDYGTVFRITPSGHSIITLYTFDLTNGAEPQGGLTLGPDRNFYGTTSFGQNTNGSIFKITSDGSLTILHIFTGGTDGSTPATPPVLGNDGNFYGNAEGGFEATGYRISSTGDYEVLTGSIPGGGQPSAPLMQALDGNFYSTSYSGGTNDAGTVYRMSPAGAVTIIYNFDSTHGGWGYAPVVQDDEGNLYGAEAEGGKLDGGDVFKVTSRGKLTVLHNFVNRDYNHGSVPVGGVVLATDGKLYGSAYRGGPENGGSLFNLTTAGKYKEFYIFDGNHGSGPQTTAMQHTNGKIYGMTSGGGAYGGGVMYCIDAALPPFVRLVFTAGKVGRSIGILGQGFKGTTTVSFNGTPATFRVVSDTYLMATVPAGATTGSVSVTTPKSVLKSNQEFRVKP
jgi:uncharacterized repeat protein (TIGR03803 family)